MRFLRKLLLFNEQLFGIFGLVNLSIITNGSSNEEETAENPLGVLPYQFEPECDSNDAEHHVTTSTLELVQN